MNNGLPGGWLIRIPSNKRVWSARYLSAKLVGHRDDNRCDQGLIDESLIGAS